MAKVVVTGAAGFIGSHLTESCLRQGHTVIGVDSFTPYYDRARKQQNLARIDGHAAWTLIEGNLMDLDLVSVFDGVDIVFHLAAQPGVRPSWGETFKVYADCNVLALQRVLEAARCTRPTRFVFASSSSVYGNATRRPTPEAESLQPVSPYGATKVFGEHLCHTYHHNYGLATVMLRYFTVYGPRQRPDMAFNRFIEAALKHEEIVIYGDGEQTRDFTFVSDAVNATVAAAWKGSPYAAYNLGGGTRTSMNEVLDLVGEITGETLKVRRVTSQMGDARDTAADTSRARAQLDFAPARSLREGLEEQVAWHRDMLRHCTERQSIT